MAFYYLTLFLDAHVNMGDIPLPADTSNESILLWLVILLGIASLIWNYASSKKMVSEHTWVVEEVKKIVPNHDKLVRLLPSIEKHEEKHEDFVWVHKQVYDWEASTKAIKELKEKYDREKQEHDRVAKTHEEKEWESRMQSLLQVVSNFQKENIKERDSIHKRMEKIEKTFEELNFKKLNSLAGNLEILVSKLNVKV